MKYFIVLLLTLTFTSCNEKVEKAAEAQEEQADHDHDHHDHDHHDHGHAAPNGGILTGIGDHSASLEWLIEENQFKLFIFDGCAEKPIRVADKELKININTNEDKMLTLLPVTNELTGEKPGDANTFTAKISGITKEEISGISVQSVTIQGINYSNVNLETN